MKRFHLPGKWVFFVPLFLVVPAIYFLFFAERFDAVIPGKIYRSGGVSAGRLESLIKEYGIRTIINLTGSYREKEWYTKEQEAARRNNVTHFTFNLSPHELPGFRAINRITELIEKADKPVLIHCRRGADRTGLVSAIALSVEEDRPLVEIKKQFSWRYGVLPVYQSTGPSFFSQYEGWLKKAGKQHSREVLIGWMKTEYTDSQENIDYFIDSVNGRIFEREKVSIDLRDRAGKISLEGWALDARTDSPLKGLRISIGAEVSDSAVMRRARPDVAGVLGIGGEPVRTFPAGWKADFEKNSLKEGCHGIYLSIEKDGSGTFEIPTGLSLCIEGDS
ncbi:MAG: tyrosine-protein phosphatase [Nitrospirae bacterium]|nr:tyrosine-protein phosphatase [Nitrospirota bacterium]